MIFIWCPLSPFFSHTFFSTAQKESFIIGKTLYVFSSAALRRKDNTLILQTKHNSSSYIPVEIVDEILIMGEAEINKSLIELLSEKRIVLHFFDHFGKYTGTYSPPENKNSGQVFLSQAAHWLNERKRHELAAAFVIGAIGNMINLIKYYQRRRENINAGEIIDFLKLCLAHAPDTSDVQSLMGIEGTARNTYYQFFDMLISDSTVPNHKACKETSQQHNECDDKFR